MHSILHWRLLTADSTPNGEISTGSRLPHHNNEGGCHRGQRRPRKRANAVWSRVTPLRFPLSVRNSICCGVDAIQDFEVESG